MKLPEHGRALVPKEKITDYLLSFTHRDGQHKAAFFAAFGFSSDAWHLLADALIHHAGNHEIAKEEASPFGTRFVIEGPINAPDGRTLSIRAVWFIRNGEDAPRFVTAYPLKGESV